MSIAYDNMLLADWEFRDDLQEVTIRNGVSGSEVEGVKAKNQVLSFRQVMLGGSLGYEPTDQTWMIGCRVLGDVTIVQGDVLIDSAGTRWTVLSSVLRSFGDTPIYYETVCRKQV